MKQGLMEALTERKLEPMLTMLMERVPMGEAMKQGWGRLTLLTRYGWQFCGNGDLSNPIDLHLTSRGESQQFVFEPAFRRILEGLAEAWLLLEAAEGKYDKPEYVAGNIVVHSDLKPVS